MDEEEARRDQDTELPVDAVDEALDETAEDDEADPLMAEVEEEKAWE